jgi:hypothetical protein
MASRLPKLAILIFLPAAGGCAFSPVNKPNPALYQNAFAHEKSVPSAQAATLDAAKTTLQAIGYEIQSVTPEVGQILTKATTVAVPQLCDCGTWNLDPVHGTARSLFKVTVTASGSNQSTVAIEHLCDGHFIGQNLSGATTRDETYVCASRGTIENDFWSMLDKILAARAARATAPQP